MPEGLREILPVYDGGCIGKVIETATKNPLISAVVPHSQTESKTKSTRGGNCVTATGAALGHSASTPSPPLTSCVKRTNSSTGSGLLYK